MSMRQIACPQCKRPLHPDLFDGEFHFCPSCQAPVQVYIFPAFMRPAAAAPPALTPIEGQSSCFYHPQKSAVVACESCGRFLCTLCDVEIGGVHRCPGCWEAGKRKQQLQTLETQHTRYDRIALALTTLTILFWPLNIIAAPAALFIVIRFWNRRSKILPGSRVVFIIAGLLALAETCGWIFLFYMIFFRARPIR